LLSQFSNWFGKVLQTRVVLEHPEAPEDTRVLNLFRNRAELKKVLGDTQDELHRLKDRVKLGEAATARVREQLEHLESRLAAPMTGLHALLHYQLRDLWATGHAQIAALIRELAQQREDRERRQFLADLNRQLFERQQSARAECAQAEHVAADVRTKLVAIQDALARSQGWWQYFKKRELSRRLVAMQAEMRVADDLLHQARDQLMKIEEQGGAKYPGLSLQARRVLNLTAIAAAQVLALRLSPPTLHGAQRAEDRWSPGCRLQHCVDAGDRPREGGNGAEHAGDQRGGAASGGSPGCWREVSPRFGYHACRGVSATDLADLAGEIRGHDLGCAGPGPLEPVRPLLRRGRLTPRG
jgi:hypothetical protein